MTPLPLYPLLGRVSWELVAWCIDGFVIKLGGWGLAVDLTPGTASTILLQIRPFWPSYLDAFVLVKAWHLPK